MSDTPRTDRAQQLGHAPASWPDVNEHWVTATFARTLERENAALRGLLAEAVSDVARNDLGADQDSLYHRMKAALETEGHSQDTAHKQGCPALGGYGTADRTCICEGLMEGGS